MKLGSQIFEVALTGSILNTSFGGYIARDKNKLLLSSFHIISLCL